MRQTTALTAVVAAAAAGFGAMDAQAATLNYSLTFTFSSNIGNVNGAGSSGVGAFSIDSGDLAGNTDITDPSKIHDFSATFSNVPNVGTVSFDQGDLDSVLLKHTGTTITGASFGTASNGTDPDLDSLAFSTTRLNLADETAIEYNTTATQIPEPGTLSLLAAGAALPLIRRRRAQRKAA